MNFINLLNIPQLPFYPSVFFFLCIWTDAIVQRSETYFSIEGQTVNILAFVSHMLFVANMQLRTIV